MRKVEARELGEVGRAYVRAYLTGVNAFCTALLAVVDSTSGEVFTFAPTDTTPERLLEFEQGGLLPENLSGEGAVSVPGGTWVPVISLIDKQIELLKEAMTTARGAVCIADDSNPRWSDNLPYLGPAAFGVGDEVYHLLTLDTAEDDFFNAVTNKTLWHDVSAVCGVSPKLDQARTSTPRELEQAAASAILITCVAYDGEGFVVWRRTAD